MIKKNVSLTEINKLDAKLSHEEKVKAVFGERILSSGLGDFIEKHNGIGTGTTSLENLNVSGSGVFVNAITLPDGSNDTDSVNLGQVKSLIGRNYISITESSGEITKDQLAVLQANKSNYVLYNNFILRLVKDDNATMIYSNDDYAVYITFEVDISTREYEVETDELQTKIYVNQTLKGTESYLTSIKVDGTLYKIGSTEFDEHIKNTSNPHKTTYDNLTSKPNPIVGATQSGNTLKLTFYQSGGFVSYTPTFTATLYMHKVSFERNESTGYARYHFMFITSSSETFNSKQKILDALADLKMIKGCRYLTSGSDFTNDLREIIYVDGSVCYTYYYTYDSSTSSLVKTTQTFDLDDGVSLVHFSDTWQQL